MTLTGPERLRWGRVRVTREIDYEPSGNAFAEKPGVRRAERAHRKLAEDVPYFQPSPDDDRRHYHHHHHLRRIQFGLLSS